MEEPEKPEDPKPAAIAIFDGLESAKIEISSRLEKHLDEDKFLRGLLRKMKRNDLETLIMPVFSKIIEGDDTKLNLSVLCEATPDLHHYVSTRFGFLMAEGCKNILSNDYLMPYIEPKVELKHDSTETSFTFRECVTDEEICRFSYYKKIGDNFGSLRFVFNNQFAMKGKLASNIYFYVWKWLVADEKRLKLYNEEETAKAGNELGLEVYTSRTGLNFIGGYKALKEQINRDVFYPFTNQDLIEKISKITRVNVGDSPVNAVLFYGPPGTGKTMMAKAIASEKGITLMRLSLSDVYTKWYGESQRKLKQALDYVDNYSKDKKVVLFIDEIDYLGRRGMVETGTDMEDQRTLENMLTWLDGLDTKRNNGHLLVIGATNIIEKIDPALMRRFNSKIYFDKPSKEDRLEIINLYAQHLPKEDLEIIAAKTDGLVGDELMKIAKKAEYSWGMHLLEKGIEEASGPALAYYLKSIEEITGKKISTANAPEGIYR